MSNNKIGSKILSDKDAQWLVRDYHHLKGCFKMFFDKWKKTPEQECAVGDFDFVQRLYLELDKHQAMVDSSLSEEQKERYNWALQKKKFKVKFIEPFEKWSGKTLRGGIFHDLY